MKTPTKSEMRAINEWLPGVATALNHMKAQAGQLGLFKTMHALDEGTKALGYEIADARLLFESSGRRAKNKRR